MSDFYKENEQQPNDVNLNISLVFTGDLKCFNEKLKSPGYNLDNEELSTQQVEDQNNDIYHHHDNFVFESFNNAQVYDQKDNSSKSIDDNSQSLLEQQRSNGNRSAKKQNERNNKKTPKLQKQIRRDKKHTGHYENDSTMSMSAKNSRITKQSSSLESSTIEQSYHEEYQEQDEHSNALSERTFDQKNVMKQVCKEYASELRSVLDYQLSLSDPEICQKMWQDWSKEKICYYRDNHDYLMNILRKKYEACWNISDEEKENYSKEDLNQIIQTFQSETHYSFRNLNHLIYDQSSQFDEYQKEAFKEFFKKHIEETTVSHNFEKERVKYAHEYTFYTSQLVQLFYKKDALKRYNTQYRSQSFVQIHQQCRQNEEDYAERMREE